MEVHAATVDPRTPVAYALVGPRPHNLSSNPEGVGSAPSFAAVLDNRRASTHESGGWADASTERTPQSSSSGQEPHPLSRDAARAEGGARGAATPASSGVEGGRAGSEKPERSPDEDATKLRGSGGNDAAKPDAPGAGATPGEEGAPAPEEPEALPAAPAGEGTTGEAGDPNPKKMVSGAPTESALVHSAGVAPNRVDHGAAARAEGASAVLDHDPMTDEGSGSDAVGRGAGATAAGATKSEPGQAAQLASQQDVQQGRLSAGSGASALENAQRAESESVNRRHVAPSAQGTAPDGRAGSDGGDVSSVQGQADKSQAQTLGPSHAVAPTTGRSDGPGGSSTPVGATASAATPGDGMLGEETDADESLSEEGGETASRHGKTFPDGTPRTVHDAFARVQGGIGAGSSQSGEARSGTPAHGLVDDGPISTLRNGQPQTGPPVSEGMRPAASTALLRAEQALDAKLEHGSVVGHLRDNGEMRLALRPHGLGELEVRIAIREGGVQANVAASHEEARQLLTSQRHDLEAALQRYNLRLDSFSVDVGGRDGRSFAQNEPQETVFGYGNTAALIEAQDSDETHLASTAIRDVAGAGLSLRV